MGFLGLNSGMKHECSGTSASHVIPSGRPFLSSQTLLTHRGSQNGLQGNPVVPPHTTFLPMFPSALHGEL